MDQKNSGQHGIKWNSIHGDQVIATDSDSSTGGKGASFKKDDFQVYGQNSLAIAIDDGRVALLDTRTPEKVVYTDLESLEALVTSRSMQHATS